MLVLQRCQPHGQHLCSLSNTSRTKNASPHWPTITINIRSANFKASATTTGEDTERGGGGKTTEIDQIYHTTCSPPYHQHYNKDVILQSWSQESSGLFTTSERKREITRCVCIVGQTLCFSFCRAWPGQTASFLLASARSTEPWLSNWPCWKRVFTTACGTENHMIQLEGKPSGTCHETPNRNGIQHLGLLHQSHYTVDLGFDRAETHKDADWNSMFLLGSQNYKVFGAWVTHIYLPAHHGGPGLNSRQRCGAVVWPWS